MKFGIFSILPCLFRKRAEMRLSCHRHDSWELGPKFSTQKCNKHEFFCLVFRLTRTWPQFSKNTLSSKHVLHCSTENLNEILMIPEKNYDINSHADGVRYCWRQWMVSVKTTLFLFSYSDSFVNSCPRMILNLSISGKIPKINQFLFLWFFFPDEILLEDFEIQKVM